MRRTYVAFITRGHFYINCYFYLGRNGVGLQLLRLVMRYERVDERIEVTFHHEIELVNRQTNAMITDAIVFEVVSANLLRAITGTYHRAPLTRECVVLLLLFELLQARTQNAHRFFTVLDLRLLVLH